MMYLKQLLIASILSLFVSTAVLSAEIAGDIHFLKGRATATTVDGDIRVISKGSKLYSSETISTSLGSYARMQLKDKTWITLRPDSRFLLQKVEYDEETNEGTGFFALLKGGFRAVTGLISNKQKYKYNTRVATIGIRGTSFAVRICNGDCLDIDPPPPDGLYLEVFDHSVVVENKQGSYAFKAGEFAYIANDSTPAVALGSRPQVFVQSPIPVADPADCDP
jgi:hypothetical protein